MCSNIIDLGVKFFKGVQSLAGYFSSSFYVGIFGQEERDYELFVVSKVDEVLVVVEVDNCELRVGFSLCLIRATFCRLPLVWLRALIRRVVVCMNF